MSIASDQEHTRGCSPGIWPFSRFFKKIAPPPRVGASDGHPEKAAAPDAPIQLCSRCRVLSLDDLAHGGTVLPQGMVSFPNAEKSNYRGKHIYLPYRLVDKFPELEILGASAAEGCVFCAFLRKELQIHLKPEAQQTVKIARLSYRLGERNQFASYSHDDGKPHALDALFVYGRIIKSFSLRLDIQAEAEDPCAKWLSIERRPLHAGHPGGLSERRVQRLRSMVETAHANMSTRHVTEQFTPTRLLDVSGERIRLIITRRGAPLRYAALSYCWGPPEVVAAQVKTEKSTLKKRKAGIDLESLPATVRDAVIVCRALNIPYLWVDALCIIQGDRDDWERESLQMARVYEWAYLTICAVQGNSCVTGMLNDHSLPHKVNIPFASTLNPAVKGTFSIFSSPYSGHTKFSGGRGSSSNAFNPDHSVDVIQSAWYTRAWTFQEMSMGMVQLFFGRRMAHVHQLDKNAVENEDGSSCHLDLLSDATPYSFRTNSDGVSPHTGDHQIWYSAVEHYSSRKLSYESDKFPAMSSLASLVAARLKFDFVAGLWKSELHYGLLWFRAWPNEEIEGSEAASSDDDDDDDDDESSSSSREHSGDESNDEGSQSASVEQGGSPTLPWEPGFGDLTTQKVAPSWSWASRTFPVRWYDYYWPDSYHSEIKLAHVSVEVDGLNPFGTIKDGGSLTIEAKVFHPSKDTSSLVQSKKNFFRRWLETPDVYDLRHDGHYIASLVWDAQIDVGLVDITRVSLLLTCRQGHGDHGDDMLGLLVVSTDIASSYRRVGIFGSANDRHRSEKFWKAIVFSQVVLV